MTSSTNSSAGANVSGLAAFDFDGTLRRGDSLLPFLSAVAGRRAAVAAIVLAAVKLAASRRRSDRDAIKDLTFARLFADRSAQQIAELAENFGETLVGDLRPDVVGRLRQHQDAGHEVVIVSASLVVYLEPVARHLGCRLSATRLVVGPAGMFTGEIDGANCRGPEKVARLEELYPIRPETVWAYGDSRGDEEMLAWADHGVRIRSKAIIGPL